MSASLIELIGEIAYQEYQGATEEWKPRLEEWARSLRNMSDSEFVAKAASAVHGSALVQRFRGNFEHEHCKASACYFESRRRWEAQGHAEDCSGSTLYARAFRNVWIDQGHDPDAAPVNDCDCGQRKKATSKRVTS